MPRVRHPRDRDDVAGHLPDRVSVLGDSYAVRDGWVDLPGDRHVRTLADAYDLSPADLRDDTAETCDTVKADGDVCGRDLPCPYHSDTD